MALLPLCASPVERPRFARCGYVKYDGSVLDCQGLHTQLVLDWQVWRWDYRCMGDATGGTGGSLGSDGDLRRRVFEALRDSGVMQKLQNEADPDYAVRISLPEEAAERLIAALSGKGSSG